MSLVRLFTVIGVFCGLTVFLHISLYRFYWNLNDRYLWLRYYRLIKFVSFRSLKDQANYALYSEKLCLYGVLEYAIISAIFFYICDQVHWNGNGPYYFGIVWAFFITALGGWLGWFTIGKQANLAGFRRESNLHWQSLKWSQRFDLLHFNNAALLICPLILISVFLIYNFCPWDGRSIRKILLLTSAGFILFLIVLFIKGRVRLFFQERPRR